MSHLIDLTGMRFGRLTVICASKSNHGQLVWRCKCDCGNETIVFGSHLKSGHTQSCGCLHKETIEQFASKNRYVKNKRLHRIWQNAKSRCNNKNVPCFSYYGGRGITVCEEWKDYAAFEKWAEQNGYSDELTLDRIDVNGNYEPSNCRWVTHKEQMRNTRSNRLLEYCGQKRAICEWAEITGISAERINNRINALGWSVEKALTTPVNTKMGRKRK